MTTRSAAARQNLHHPVIDGDGHLVEIVPVLEDYLREIGGPKLFERYRANGGLGLSYYDGGVERVGGPKGWNGLSRGERRDLRVTHPAFWAVPTAHALDRATIMLPKLYRERLDELGIDFSVLFGTSALSLVRNPDEEIRRAGCRAYNMMVWELYKPHADRMTPVALIPMTTPAEAIDELDFAIGKLGMKAITVEGVIRRPIPRVQREDPTTSSFATWLDTLGQDSEYDYDPVWRKCVELKVAPTCHSASVGWGARASTENFVYNHIGHFAAACDAFCKALVIGGVPLRFPELKFAFLEGGVAWAGALYNALVEHWEKRNMKAMRENLDPEKLDRAAIGELFVRYGGKLAEKREEALRHVPGMLNVSDPVELDDFSRLPIQDSSELAAIFDNFFFGCEGDDKLTAFAFNSKVYHHNLKLNAMFSSDIGHWDVQDITATVAEAYELVEDGLITESDFREFTFTNALKLHGSMNADFFKGTIIEAARV